MSDATIATRQRRVRPLTYIALAVSVIVSAGLWFGVEGLSTEAVIQSPFGEFWGEVPGLALIFPIGIVAGIVLDVIAGVRRGRNRVIAVIAGLLLLSPGLLVLRAVIVALVSRQ